MIDTRLGFVTCVQLGLECMQAIYESCGRLELAITLPDDRAVRKSGRVYLDEFCRSREIPLLKTPNVNDAVSVEAVRAQRVDWLFIVGWSQIARAEVLAAPLRGALGIHPTLLPQGRGRAAIPWAILKGLGETGVTMFQLDEGVDSGPIIAQLRLDLAPDETATSLYSRVADAHVALIREVVPRLLGGGVVPVPQDHSKATYWPGRTPADGEIRLTMTVGEVERLVRAVTRPYPGAYLVRPEGVLRIWSGRAVGEPGTAADPGYRIQLKDGWYEALDYEVTGLDVVA
jgi:methionyl-tRNA formyltransferase